MMKANDPIVIIEVSTNIVITNDSLFFAINLLMKTNKVITACK